MKQDFLSELIGSPQRARVLRALIFNENEQFTASRAGKRAGLSPDIAIRELNVLQKIGIAKRGKISILNKKTKRKRDETAWSLQANFPHLRALSTFVREISPMKHEQILGALKKSGRLSTVVLSGSFIGDLTRPADIILGCDELNERKLEGAMKALEPVFGRELRYAAFSTPEFRYRITIQDKLIRDTLDFPHIVLLDRSGLF
ncbi:hypothetical protein HY968_03410 [Candidatus Kaiserbacteria bacterium]|nr:hypothetical protein [Candidatus Kaiserbacteria bacterium]